MERLGWRVAHCSPSDIDCQKLVARNERAARDVLKITKELTFKMRNIQSRKDPFHALVHGIQKWREEK